VPTAAPTAPPITPIAPEVLEDADDVGVGGEVKLLGEVGYCEDAAIVVKVGVGVAVILEGRGPETTKS